MIGLLIFAAAAMAAAAAPSTIPHIEALNQGADILFGSGCNVVIVRTSGGLLMIDDQRPSDFGETTSLLRERYNVPVRTVINTHFHLDHSGGNAQFARDGAEVIGQQNVRVRLGDKLLNERYRAHYPGGGTSLAPTRTYTKSLEIRFGSERIDLVHIANGHTDGDSLVKLRHANVLHLGDVFFNGLYPHIDTDSGGTIQGNIRSVKAALRMSDDGTRVVPGHGPVATRRELQAYLAMLVQAENVVRAQIAAGRTLAECVALRPADRFKRDGDADEFVTAIYKSLKPSGT